MHKLHAGHTFRAADMILLTVTVYAYTAGYQLQCCWYDPTNCHCFIHKLQDVSFSAGDTIPPGTRVVVDKATVQAHVDDFLMKTDLSRYVL